jgi:hypothetical protein
VIRERRSLAGIAEGGIPSDPQTDAFLEWARENGRNTLAKYLLAHPVDTVKQTIGKRQRLLSGVTAGYRPPDARNILPEPLDELIYPRDAQDVYFWMIVVGLGAGAVLLTLGGRRTWWVPGVAFALQAPHAIVVYHGDTLEIPRHAMLVAITTRLSLLILALFVLDRVLEHMRARRITLQTGTSKPETAPV